MCINVEPIVQAYANSTKELRKERADTRNKEFKNSLLELTTGGRCTVQSFCQTLSGDKDG